MPRPPLDWPALPELEDPAPRTPRRAWGKLSHTERYRRQRHDLLRAAARLASRDGYDGTRVADIVSEAGLSKSTFYEHFDSKEDCFLELHRLTSAHMLHAGVEAAERHVSDGPYTCILAVVRALLGYPARDPRLARALGPELGTHVPAIAEQREQNTTRIVELFVTLGRRLGSTLCEEDLHLAAEVIVRGAMTILPARGAEAAADGLTRLGCRAFALEPA